VSHGTERIEDGLFHRIMATRRRQCNLVLLWQDGHLSNRKHAARMRTLNRRLAKLLAKEYRLTH
jgi:hypothetical protein